MLSHKNGEYGGSPGQVVMGRDSRLRGHGFDNYLFKILQSSAVKFSHWNGPVRICVCHQRALHKSLTVPVNTIKNKNTCLCSKLLFSFMHCPLVARHRCAEPIGLVKTYLGRAPTHEVHFRFANSYKASEKNEKV